MLTIVEQYIAERDLCPLYAAHLRRTARMYGMRHFSYTSVNDWLTSISGTRSPQTVNDYRRMILTLWNYAADQGLTGYPVARKVRRFRSSLPVPTAFTRSQIERLAEASDCLTGVYPTGVARSDYWRALVVGAYDLGFRRGDLVALPYSISNGRPFAWREHKTQQVQVRQLSAIGCKYVQRYRHRLAYPWGCSWTTFANDWRRLCRSAGVSGQFRWLRRSYVTYSGWRHVDPRVSRDYYIDPSIAAKPQNPPPILPKNDQ